MGSKMKLRNKKTGIIGELHFEPEKEYHFTVVTEDPADVMIYKKLAALYVDWEDYEDPNYYYLTCTGVVACAPKEVAGDEEISIGNYFETRAEAEQAVEKLKAWERLKDKGFRFERWLLGGEYGNTITFSDYIKCDDETRADLDLLFGGGR